jgi:hypothetical protein
MQAAPAARDRVGYRNPPARHRFKKGKSGNPRGRRKGERNLLSIFKELVLEKVRVRIGGEVRTMTRGEAVLRVNYAAALKKDQKAMHNLFIIAEEGQHFVDRTDPAQVGRPIGVGERMTTEEWIATFSGKQYGD